MKVYLGTGKVAPYIGEVLDSAFNNAQAVIVLLTPDDQVRLLPELCHPEEDTIEKEYHLQSRPNVLFEAGMAFGRNVDRTLLIEVGRVKPFSFSRSLALFDIPDPVRFFGLCPVFQTKYIPIIPRLHSLYLP